MEVSTKMRAQAQTRYAQKACAEIRGNMEFSEQLKIYALGYQELTGEKANYMEVYQLDSEKRIKEEVTETVIQDVRKDIADAATNIRNNNLMRKCNKENCSKCHLNHLCLSKKEKKQYAI